MGRTAGAWLVLLGVTLFAAQAAAAASVAPSAVPVSALGGIRPGSWRIRTLGSGGPARQRLCVADAAGLIQVRHGPIACTRFVIADNARDATVHYSCPGAGWGRTSLRIDSDLLVQIETQGIADNAPFAFKAEARRTGSCGQARAPAVR